MERIQDQDDDAIKWGLIFPSKRRSASGMKNVEKKILTVSPLLTRVSV